MASSSKVTQMDRILLVLILINLLNIGSSSKQVSVLKYKGGNECSSALVGVTTKPYSSTSSLLDEFTFCGKYYFRFLRSSCLMGLEPDLILKITDFENNMGYLMLQGVYYRFAFPNHKVTPDSWQYLCLAISSTQIKIVLNGQIILSDPKLDITAEIKKTKLWLGGALFSDKEPNRRLGGMIAYANFWNNALQNEDLILITSNNKTAIASEKYDLLSDTISKSSSCIDYLVLDENDKLFQELYPEDFLIEYRVDFDSSRYLCEGYGGNMTLPQNTEDLKTLGYFIKQSEICHEPFLGLKKSSNGEIQDLNGNHVSYLKWHLNQPNGGDSQKCISTWGSYIDDIECDKRHCFICNIPQKSMFLLRGPIPANTERKYFVTVNSQTTEIRGLIEIECVRNEGKWNFGKNLKLDNVTNNMPPVGLKNWNNGQKLKFTQCKKDEFTCHTYGHCISMNKRCNGFPDCPNDGSDENECKIMTLSKGYDEKNPSVQNISSFISLKVFGIHDIDELHMSYTVHFRIQLKWFDSRITFRNLKAIDYKNKLDILEIDKIWTPKLYIMSSTNIYVKAGQNSQEVDGYVEIHRNGYPKENELIEIDEDYLYPGNENPIIMVNYITLKLGCKFDLKWYPFDTQKCPIYVETAGDFNMKWNDPPITKEMILTQYDAYKYLDYNNETSSTIIGVEITLCRKLPYHIINIYIPTLCLMMIAGFTLFIDFSHFEVSIMIALTSMLVTYTLYQSISAYLPQTSYMKMIDIWLFGGLTVPFVIITILVIMDYLIMREKDQVIDVTYKGTILKSTKFMKTMQILLLTIGSTLCVLYWIIGLHHYYNACPM